MILQKACK